MGGARLLMSSEEDRWRRERGAGRTVDACSGEQKVALLVQKLQRRNSEEPLLQENSSQTIELSEEKSPQAAGCLVSSLAAWCPAWLPDSLPVPPGSARALKLGFQSASHVRWICRPLPAPSPPLPPVAPIHYATASRGRVWLFLQKLACMCAWTGPDAAQREGLTSAPP